MAAGPLMCWDFFMDNHHRRMRRLDGWQSLKHFAGKNGWRIDWNLEKLLVKEGKVALVTDLSFRIRFATQNLVEMNGYEPKEVMGKTPAMFQGEQTAMETRLKIRTALQQLKPFHVTLINYHKHGTLYNCEVEGYPVFNKERRHTHFIAFEQTAPL